MVQQVYNGIIERVVNTPKLAQTVGIKYLLHFYSHGLKKNNC